MDEKEFLEHKKKIREKIASLYEKQDLFSVINLLENSELDFELCNELVRAYINSANKTSDPFSLYEKANTLLDRFELEGRNDAHHLFYRGYILFKQGLIEDSKIRFERALRFANVGDERLFANITAMLENANAQINLAAFEGLKSDDRAKVIAHIEKNFGGMNHLCSFDKVDIYQIAPQAKHDYNLLVSVGLSARVMTDKSSGGRESFEVCLCLPRDYRFNPDSKSSFEVYLMIEVIKHLISTKDFTGFGYYLEKENGFSRRTAFNGVMLVGMGEYSQEEQTLSLPDRTVSFLELLPLRPMELNFRKTHTAQELLKLFEEKLVMITPFISTRDDVCSSVPKV